MASDRLRLLRKFTSIKKLFVLFLHHCYNVRWMRHMRASPHIAPFGHTAPDRLRLMRKFMSINE